MLLLLSSAEAGMSEARIDRPLGGHRNGAGGEGGGAAAEPTLSSATRLYLAILAAGVALLAVLTVYPGWEALLGGRVVNLAPAVSIGVSVVLGAIPVLICQVQTTARARQLEKLRSIRALISPGVRYYEVALTAVAAISPATLSNDYIVPMLTFSFVTAVSCLMTFMGGFGAALFTQPSHVLGGMRILMGVTPEEIAVYQQGTYVVAAMAFLGAYVYTLGRLLDRLNNNDLYPISFYYYTARIVIACLVAVIFRHAAELLGLGGSQGLVLLGFVTGLAPDLFVLAMARKAFQALKVFGGRADPDEATRPVSLPLLMVDELTRDKIDRLNELGIDSAQALACQNPFLIWPRLPYELGLIVDWIAQAQLYALVKEAALQKLRAAYVTDIFDLEVRLQDPGARAEMCQLLGVPEASAAALLRQIEDDQSFNRLREVRDALIPKVPAVG
jgi:hypothetical protein